MRKVEGSMTVEASLLMPMVCSHDVGLCQDCEKSG